MKCTWTWITVQNPGPGPSLAQTWQLWGTQASLQWPIRFHWRTNLVFFKISSQVTPLMSQQKFANRLRGRRGGGRAGGWLEIKSFSSSQLEHIVCEHIIQQKLLPCVFRVVNENLVTVDWHKNILFNNFFMDTTWHLIYYQAMIHWWKNMKIQK